MLSFPGVIFARLRSAAVPLFACFLFLLALGRFATLSERYPLLNDEGAGIAEAADYPVAQMLAEGVKGELNASPLHYLLDRPYALWFALSYLHFYLLLLTLRDPGPLRNRWPVIAVNLLLALTTFASASQILAGAAMRAAGGHESPRRRASFFAAELLPAALICLHYFRFGSWQARLGDDSFWHVWAVGLYYAVVSPIFEFTATTEIHGLLQRIPPAGFIAFSLAMLFMPPWRGRSTLAWALRYIRLVLLLAVPVTLLAWFHAGAFTHKYLVYLYPYLMLLQPCAVAGVAGVLHKAGLGRISPAPVLLFAGLQLWYRAPIMGADLNATTRLLPRCICLVRKEATPECPERLTDFRELSKNAVDANRLNRVCLAGSSAVPGSYASNCPLDGSANMPWRCD